MAKAREPMIPLEATPARVPARVRARNAPPNFVGRAVACERLERALASGPVAVVWGLGGLGKTALVLHVLQARFANSPTVMVALRPDGGGALEILRTIAVAAGVQVDARLGGEAADAILAAAIEIADERELVVVLDDLHHVPDSDAILRSIASIARRSRFVATSRVRPSVPEIVEQVIALEPLGEAEMSELAQRCAPQLDERARRAAVVSSAGSPWLLRRALAGSSDGAHDANLDPMASAVVAALRLVSSPIPRSVLLTLTGAGDARLEALERQGIVELFGANVRLHDVARELLPVGDQGVSRQRDALSLAGALSRHGGPNETLAAIRLLLEVDHAAGVALASTRGESLVLAGYAREVWSLIEHLEDRSLARVRLRVADALGDPAAVTRVTLPADPSVDDRMLWATAAAIRWDPPAMLEAARAAFQHALAESSNVSAMVAGLVAIQAAAFCDAPDLRSIVDRVSGLVCDEANAVARDVFAAVGLLYLGDYAAAARAADATERSLSLLPPELRRQAIEAMTAIPRTLRRVDDAERLLDLQEREIGAGPLSLDAPRGIAIHRLTLAVARGDLDEARRLRAVVTPFVERPSMRRVVARRAVIDARLDEGDLVAIESDIRAFIAEAEARRDVFAASSGNVALIALARLLGRRCEELELPEERVARRGLLGDLRELHRLAVRARHGEANSEETRAVAERFATPCEARCLALLAHAQALIAEGREAAQATWSAISAIEQIGYRLLLPEARAVLCEALYLAGDAAGVREAASSLASAMRSPRYEAEAALYAHLLEDVPNPSLLEEWASLADRSPVVARRAQALLGGNPRLDAIDRHVLDKHRERTQVTIRRLAGPSDVRPGWGLDAVRKRVWIAGREPVDLEDSAIAWRCLETIALAAPGEATVEDIVAVLWKGEVYHPFKHKPRLHPLIKKLRKMLEVDSAAPERLVTTENGYALGDAAPVRLLRRSRG